MVVIKRLSGGKPSLRPQPMLTPDALCMLWDLMKRSHSGAVSGTVGGGFEVATWPDIMELGDMTGCRRRNIHLRSEEIRDDINGARLFWI